jgi:hypothetical protein
MVQIFVMHTSSLSSIWWCGPGIANRFSKDHLLRGQNSVSWDQDTDIIKLCYMNTI